MRPHCDRYIVEHAGPAIQWLIDQGVPFTKDTSGETWHHLAWEGGHSHRRIIHAADATGEAVITADGKGSCASGIFGPRQHIAIDLITDSKLGRWQTAVGRLCIGRETDKVLAISSKHTVLATGGAGKVYLYTTNPDIATGTVSQWAGERLPGSQYGVHPVSSHLPVSSARQILPDFGSRAEKVASEAA